MVLVPERRIDGSTVIRSWLAADSSHLSNQIPNGVEDELRLVDVDVVTALGGHQQSAVRRERREFPLEGHASLTSRLVRTAGGKNDQRERSQGSRWPRGSGIELERG